MDHTLSCGVCIKLGTEAHSEPSQTSKMELFAKIRDRKQKTAGLANLFSAENFSETNLGPKQISMMAFFPKIIDGYTLSTKTTPSYMFNRV